MSQEPAKTIQELLSSYWDTGGVGFKPGIVLGEYSGQISAPRITVESSQVSARYFVLDSKQREKTDVVSIDISADDREDRWPIEEEIDRILSLYRANPGGGLDKLLRIGEYRRTFERGPPALYRSQALVACVWHKSSES